MTPPYIDLSSVGAAILSGGAIVVSLIWKAWPKPNGNGNGHAKDIVAHDIHIQQLRRDVAEIKGDVKQIWNCLRDRD